MHPPYQPPKNTRLNQDLTIYIMFQKPINFDIIHIKNSYGVDVQVWK